MRFSPKLNPLFFLLILIFFPISGCVSAGGSPETPETQEIKIETPAENDAPEISSIDDFDKSQGQEALASGLLENGPYNCLALVTDPESRSRVSWILYGKEAVDLTAKTGQYARVSGKAYRHADNPFRGHFLVESVLEISADPLSTEENRLPPPSQKVRPSNEAVKE
jgi:hypothetical protein